MYVAKIVEIRIKKGHVVTLPLNNFISKIMKISECVVVGVCAV